MALHTFSVSDLSCISLPKNLHSNWDTDVVFLISFYLNITVQHTSASLTINENYDSDVRDDTETFLNRVVPEVCFSLLYGGYIFYFFTSDLTLFPTACYQGRSAPWKHTIEG